MAPATYGSRAHGNGHRIPAPTGAIPTTTTTAKAGKFMKATGTAKTTTITTTMTTAITTTTIIDNLDLL